ncbi:MAG: MGMT family protein [Lentisphaeria bacterium]|nr:MGMT family protein [Lentisphaeria bacterium]
MRFPYGQIALHSGNRTFARVVGNIRHNNPDSEHIPGQNCAVLLLGLKNDYGKIQFDQRGGILAAFLISESKCCFGGYFLWKFCGDD